MPMYWKEKVDVYHLEIEGLNYKRQPTFKFTFAFAKKLQNKILSGSATEAI